MKKSNLVPIGISIVFIILAFLCIRTSVSIHEQNYRTAKGIVYEKFETRLRTSNEFIMVVKEDNGHYFDHMLLPLHMLLIKLEIEYHFLKFDLAS